LIHIVINFKTLCVAYIEDFSFPLIFHNQMQYQDNFNRLAVQPEYCCNYYRTLYL
jgi:hypothetical protein